MTYIAHLELEANDSPRCAGWSSLLQAEGCELKAFRGQVKSLPDFILNAAALWLTTDTFLHDDDLAAMVHRSIGEGKRAFVQISPNDLDLVNPFLDRYGIEGTRLGIYTDNLETGHPRLIRLERATAPEAFREEKLVAEVTTVLLQQPQAIRYGGDAIPVLSVPMLENDIYSLDTDYPANWTSPTVACLCLSEVEGTASGVLAASGNLFHDPYRGPMGHDFPGIDANQQLARNVISWLLEPADRVSARTLTAFELVDRIERSLVEFCQITLSMCFGDWWTHGVPERIREKCAVRHRQERSGLPEAAYLDLGDIPKILTAHMSLFEEDLRASNLGETGSAAVARLNGLNETRRSVMHPARRFLSDRQISDAQLDELRAVEQSVKRLLVAARERRRAR